MYVGCRCDHPLRTSSIPLMPVACDGWLRMITRQVRSSRAVGNRQFKVIDTGCDICLVAQETKKR